MAEISPQVVKELRERTGAGMMDCKSALAEAKGDMDAAIELLRKKGLKSLSNRAGKTAAEGVVGFYLHQGGQVAAMVELNCETDFVARGDDFQQLARDIAMQVAAMKPEYVSKEDVPEAMVAKEREILMAQLDEAQKAKADKIIPGRIEKFYEERVLVMQPYVKDDSGKKKVSDMIAEIGLKVKEKISIRRFQRFEVGEGIQKVQSNLADEVAATISGR